MKQIIQGKLYDTDKAELIADNEFYDGSNRISRGRATYLYRTKKGNFFIHHRTQWQGEQDSIEQVSPGEAKEHYEQLLNHAMDWEVAFGEAPEEA
jgi:hypothetical protein